METGDSTSLCIFPPYPDYSQTLLPSHEKTVTIAVTVERISRDEALDIYTKAALKVYCREFNGDCVQRGENQIEKEIRLVTTQCPPSAKTCRRKDNLPKWGAPRRQCRHSMKASGHTSVQMHKRYLDLQREDIAKAFGLLEDGNKERGRVASS